MLKKRQKRKQQKKFLSKDTKIMCWKEKKNLTWNRSVLYLDFKLHFSIKRYFERKICVGGKKNTQNWNQSNFLFFFFFLLRYPHFWGWQIFFFFFFSSKHSIQLQDCPLQLMIKVILPVFFPLQETGRRILIKSM